MNKLHGHILVDYYQDEDHLLDVMLIRNNTLF